MFYYFFSDNYIKQKSLRLVYTVYANHYNKTLTSVFWLIADRTIHTVTQAISIDNFTARRYTIAPRGMLWPCVCRFFFLCLSVSQVGVLTKRISTSSCKQRYTI